MLWEWLLTQPPLPHLHGQSALQPRLTSETSILANQDSQKKSLGEYSAKHSKSKRTSKTITEYAMFEIFEKLGDLFSNGDGGNYDTGGYESLIGGYDSLDLSHYSSDEIEDAVRNAFASDNSLHDIGHGYDVSFGAAPDVDARNLAKSALITKLSANHIYTTNLATDTLWGGLDDYSGDKVYDAINDTRVQGRITDSVYRDLIKLLKQACHTQ